MTKINLHEPKELLSLLVSADIIFQEYLTKHQLFTVHNLIRVAYLDGQKAGERKAKQDKIEKEFKI